MTQKYNELHKSGFYFLSLLQAEKSGLFDAGGGYRVKERAQRTMGGEKEKQEPKMVTPVIKHWI